MKSFFIFLFFMAVAKVQAAPIPGTGSSALTDPSKGVFVHGFGFRIHDTLSDWSAVVSAKETSSQSLRFHHKNLDHRKDASISLHFEKMEQNSTIESYARKWMKEYSSYGFEVLGTKGVLLKGEKSLLLDLTQNRKNRQIRQAVLKSDNRVVVVTCLDRKDQFADTLAACNDIIKNFEWSETK